MNSKIPTEHKAFNRFLQEESSKVKAYLRNKFSLPDDDIDDIFQESSIALYSNIKEGKLSNLTSTLSTYFLRICINQAMVFTTKRKKVVPMINESTLSDGAEFLDDKLDELFALSTFDEDEAYLQESERIVDEILKTLPDTCRNIFGGYYWQNLATKVIADMFGYANANTVKAQKYKCVDKFKKKYNEMIKKDHDR